MRNLVIILVLLILISSGAFGQVPGQIDYQGILMLDSLPVSSTVSVVFSIYATAAGGTAIWTESRSILPGSDGVFSVILGEINPISDTVFGGSGRWLGVKVGTEVEFSPRAKLVSAPYGMRVATVDGARGGSISGDLAVNGWVHSTVGGIRFPDNTTMITAASPGTGDITAVTAGNGLGGGGLTDSVELHVNTGTGVTVSADAVRLAANYIDGSVHDSRFVNEGQANSIGSPMIADGSVSLSDLALNSVNSAKVVDNSLTSADLGSNSVGNSELSTGAVTNSKLAGNSVTTDKIANGTIQEVDLGFAPNDDDWSLNGSNMNNVNPGNVGVGTASPGSKLTVRGTFRTETSGGQQLIFGNRNSENAGYWASYGPAGSVNAGFNSLSGYPDNGYVSVRNSSSAIHARMYVNSNGSGVVSTQGPNAFTNTALTYLSGYSNNGYVGVTDGAGTWQAGMYVASDGTGHVFADVKNFRVPNPDKADTDIWYASLEGPEAAAYVRGTAALVDGRAEVTLPDHFAAVASDVGITVQITPSSAVSKGIAVTQKDSKGFVAQELGGGSGSYAFDYYVMAVRKGYEDYKVIRPSSEGLGAPAENATAIESTIE